MFWSSRSIRLLRESSLPMSNYTIWTLRECFFLKIVVSDLCLLSIKTAAFKFLLSTLFIPLLSRTAQKRTLQVFLYAGYLHHKAPRPTRPLLMMTNYENSGTQIIPMNNLLAVINTNIQFPSAWDLPMVSKMSEFWWLNEQLLPGTNSKWAEISDETAIHASFDKFESVPSATLIAFLPFRFTFLSPFQFLLCLSCLIFLEQSNIVPKALVALRYVTASTQRLKWKWLFCVFKDLAAEFAAAE